jgi:hypothetical protein
LYGELSSSLTLAKFAKPIAPIEQAPLIELEDLVANPSLLDIYFIYT